jgi:NAD(P)-dependent dehydrogenase (short-subunit alcohol dehydrogenase family)
MARQSDGCGYAYNASKAALNMFTRCLAGSFRDDRVVVIALSPGWIKTDMGGPNARLELADSVPHIIALLDGLSMDNTGRFYHYDGEEVPW